MASGRTEQMFKTFNSIPNDKRTEVARIFLAEKNFSAAQSVLANHTIPVCEVQSNRAQDELYGSIEFLLGVISICFLKQYRDAIKRLVYVINATKNDNIKCKCSVLIGQALLLQDRLVESLSWLEYAAMIPGKYTMYSCVAQVLMQRVLNMINITGQQIFHKILPRQCVRPMMEPRLVQLIDVLNGQVQALAKELPTSGDPSIMERYEANCRQIADYMQRIRVTAPPPSYTELKNELDFDGYPFFPDDALGILLSQIHSSKIHMDFVKTLLHTVIKVESNFVETARSQAGAVGLMQIIPGTARMAFNNLVKKQKLESKDVYDLSAGDDNLVLGTYHLCNLVDKFDGNIVLIAAAYNAGEGNAARWVADFGYPGRDILSIFWMELISFAETRNYIKRVIEAFVVYSSLLQTEIQQYMIWRLF